MSKWIGRYVGLAQHVAHWSEDPSTKVGAVVVGANRRHIAVGYNGFPPGIKDDERLRDRSTKYWLIQHAERNALDNAQFDCQGGTIVATMFPCAECAKSIVSRGIVRVVCPPPPVREPWAESAKWARSMLLEAGLLLDVVEGGWPSEAQSPQPIGP